MKSKKAKPTPNDLGPLGTSVIDNRKSAISREAEWVASWLYAKRLRGVPNLEVINQGGPFLSLIKGNGDFLRQVADGLDELERSDAVINESGELSITIKMTPKIYIWIHWKGWESQKPKEQIEVRLALIRDKFGKGISKSRYYKIVEQLGLKST